MYIGKGKKAKSGNSKKQKLPYYGSILSTVNSDDKNVTLKRSKQTELINKNGNQNLTSNPNASSRD